LKSWSGFALPNRAKVSQHEIIDLLAKLLRLEDWDLTVRKEIEEGSNQDITDVLVLAWVLHLDGVAPRNTAKVQGHLPELWKVLAARPHYLSHLGSTVAMHFVIQRGGLKMAEDFLRSVPEFFRDEQHSRTQNVFLGREVVLAALEIAPAGVLQELTDELRNKDVQSEEWVEIFARWALLSMSRQSMNDKWHRMIAAYSIAIILDPKSSTHYLGRSRAQLQAELTTEATNDLVTALDLDPDLYISKPIALEYILRGDEEYARRAVRQSVKDFKDPGSKASALENLGVYYIRNEKWQQAFDHTSEVLGLSEKRAWNWLIRAIAAHQLEYREQAKEASKRWSGMQRRDDFEALQKYIGEKLNVYLGHSIHILVSGERTSSSGDTQGFANLLLVNLNIRVHPD
jgi:tetratricopeptide (TPR) repeat protein